MAFDLLNFFKEVEGKLKGYINVEEFIKSVLAGFAAGGTLEVFLHTVQTNLAGIILDPVLLLDIQRLIASGTNKEWVALVFGLMAVAVSLYNRFNSGAVILNPGVITESKAVVVETIVPKAPLESNAPVTSVPTA